MCSLCRTGQVLITGSFFLQLREARRRILIICDNATSSYQYAANGSFMAMDEYLKEVGISVDSFFEGLQGYYLL